MYLIHASIPYTYTLCKLRLSCLLEHDEHIVHVWKKNNVNQIKTGFSENLILIFVLQILWPMLDLQLI